MESTLSCTSKRTCNFKVRMNLLLLVSHDLYQKKNLMTWSAKGVAGFVVLHFCHPLNCVKKCYSYPAASQQSVTRSYHILAAFSVFMEDGKWSYDLFLRNYWSADMLIKIEQGLFWSRSRYLIFWGIRHNPHPPSLHSIIGFLQIILQGCPSMQPTLHLEVGTDAFLEGIIIVSLKIMPRDIACWHD